MSPHLYESLVQDRLLGAVSRAEFARLSKPEPEAHTGRRLIRDAVGLRLIAIGVRLVDHPVAVIEDMDRAA